MNERAKLHGCLVILEQIKLTQTRRGNSSCWQLTGGYDNQVIKLTVYQEAINKFRQAGYDVSKWSLPEPVNVYAPVILAWNEKNNRLEIGEVTAKEVSYG